MPRKIRELKADLRKAGFIEEAIRGKGSHTRWFHPERPDVKLTLSGHDGSDAPPYLEKQIREGIARVVRAEQEQP